MAIFHYIFLCPDIIRDILAVFVINCHIKAILIFIVIQIIPGCKKHPSIFLRHPPFKARRYRQRRHILSGIHKSIRYDIGTVRAGNAVSRNRHRKIVKPVFPKFHGKIMSKGGNAVYILPRVPSHSILAHPDILLQSRRLRRILPAKLPSILHNFSFGQPRIRCHIPDPDPSLPIPSGIFRRRKRLQSGTFSRFPSLLQKLRAHLP